MATATTDRSLTQGAKVPGQRAGAPVGADEDGAPATKSRKKLLMGVVVMVVALLAAAAGGYFMLTGGEPTPEEAAAADVEAAAAEAEEPEPGVIASLEPITINLADGRYLQVGIALQQPKPEEGGYDDEPVDGSKALDILIEKLSGKPMSDIATAEQRGAIKAELVEEVYEAYDHKVYDIYFTSWVMQ
ncbi:flagellar basal body-associated FliL family protein [Aquipuribacter sp. MA13-6]|uniref:flagellar basal body-associated FliL family protein n=1 Tax=unclassified Aquipuribacter TaxID=2635084 RepID=UPI003EEDF8E2